jgi:hypothetical protein
MGTLPELNTVLRKFPGTSGPNEPATIIFVRIRIDYPGTHHFSLSEAHALNNINSRSDSTETGIYFMICGGKLTWNLHMECTMHLYANYQEEPLALLIGRAGLN